MSRILQHDPLGRVQGSFHSARGDVWAAPLEEGNRLRGASPETNERRKGGINGLDNHVAYISGRR